MREEKEVFVVLVTVPQRAVGIRIARALVGERLAACVNIVDGVTSVYRWEDRVNEDPEELLVVKTVAGRLEEVQTKIRELHPYEVPEIVALPIVKGAEAYLEWVKGSCVDPPGPGVR